MPLLEVKNLKVHFPVKHGLFSRAHESVKAVDDVSFAIEPGETLGLVGESGCGKTTLGRAIVKLVEPTAGSILFEGENIANLSGAELRRRRRKFQMIFQDPYGSLNPRMTVGQIIGEAIDIHKLAENKRGSGASELLQAVGLDPAHAQRYPHEFSGGQRYASASPVRWLWVLKLYATSPSARSTFAVQAQIINLLQELQARRGIAYLFHRARPRGGG